MSDKDRQKKGGRNKDKKNKALRNDVNRRRRATQTDQPAET